MELNGAIDDVEEEKVDTSRRDTLGVTVELASSSNTDLDKGIAGGAHAEGVKV